MTRKSNSEIAAETLDLIPEHFHDDGCSNSPDSILCKSIHFACRIHDWRYCTRAQPEGGMSPKARKFADKELRRNICIALPWYSQWVRFLYYRAVRRFGTLNAYNTCGPSAGLICRHHMPKPTWMVVAATLDIWNATLEDI